MSTTAARAAIDALLLRYNPRQRRDSDGRWADEPGGVRADLTRSNVDMSAEEREFLSDYVEDGATYRRINDALRGQTEMTPGMADKVEKLDELTARASLNGDTTLYRAMSVKTTDPIMGQIFESGGSWADPGFGSASGDRDAVEDFQGVGSQAVVFEISAKKGQPVLVLGDDLSDRAMMQTAQEVLLPRGYRLRFDSASSRRRNGVMVHTVKATYEGVDQSQAITAAFNPNQRRGPDGRWVRNSGLNTPSLVVDLQERRERIARGVKSGVADRVPLGGGAMARIERVVFGDGSDAIHKTTVNSYDPPDGPSWSPVAQTDAEELVSHLAAGLGVRAPAVQRLEMETPWGPRPSPLEVYMELVPGQTGVASGWFNDQLRRERTLASKDALRTGLLDVLVDNPDRHGLNFLIDDEDHIYAIDHGLAFAGGERGADRSGAGNGVFSDPYVDAQGRYRDTNPLTPGDVEHARQVLEGLRPTFAARNHEDWVDAALARLEKLAQHASGTDPIYASAITAAFNPNQRRDDNGRWTKIGGGGGPSVRAQRAARRGVRPTASDSVQLPPQPQIRPAPRFADHVQGWMRREDPADRASEFWQGRFSDQRAIREVFRNIADGQDPLAGVDLDNPHLAPGYLNVTQDRPEGMDWDTWEAHPKEQFYSREDLRNELISAARWLHESLADAPVTTQTLYRGMRMPRAAVPEEGDTWTSDVISWAEERWQVERYAWMPEDPGLGRVGEMEVVMRLNGPKRSVDLGPDLLNEHLTQGKYRVVKVTGRGNKRFITVEEVAE